MIGVYITINGTTIFARTAVNRGQIAQGRTEYETDAGEFILHDPRDGAVVLAKMLLDTIKEQRPARSGGEEGERGDN